MDLQNNYEMPHYQIGVSVTEVMYVSSIKNKNVKEPRKEC